ncbi:NAD(P)H-dependent oxidoreductase [Nodosilinea nodulosa]|uniref:glutathione-regulated potassium-efflux system oxidoreductase KefF n=1 Tax=Nodosilinea nodulosa TaxID=416001 RepID=UPI000363A42B|nr:NAD(P)H-dependent oxidoreductase [Nodosilinea nodulosa]
MTSPNRILVLFAHPALHKSRINRQLVSAIADLEGVTINDLYEEYPDFHIDVKREQQLLVDHDIVVWQHPFYWYSSPALLKEWQDLVLEYGFAYGHQGTALHGKKCLSAISTGGTPDAYRREGYNYYTITELLAPFAQTARLCGMVYLPPFVVHGTHQLSDGPEIGDRAQDYRTLLQALRDDQINWAALADRTQINQDLSQILLTPEVAPHA